jgi:hypothetical protein
LEIRSFVLALLLHGSGNVLCTNTQSEHAPPSPPSSSSASMYVCSSHFATDKKASGDCHQCMCGLGPEAEEEEEER